MRRLLIWVIAIAVAVSLLAACAKPCNLTVSQAPALRGFRLGMKPEELTGRFVSFPEIKNNDLGMANINLSFQPIVENVRVIDPSNFAISRVNFQDLADVRRIEIAFVDRRAFRVAVFYANRQLWQSTDQFLNHVSATLKLPDAWQTLNHTQEYKNQSCGEVSIYAGFKPADPTSVESYPFIELTDLHAYATAIVRGYERDQRAKQQVEDQRKAFQP